MLSSSCSIRLPSKCKSTRGWRSGSTRSGWQCLAQGLQLRPQWTTILVVDHNPCAQEGLEWCGVVRVSTFHCAISVSRACVCVSAIYLQVWLAKHEDDGSLVQSPKGEGLVGINCLTKIQVPLDV